VLESSTELKELTNVVINTGSALMPVMILGKVLRCYQGRNVVLNESYYKDRTGKHFKQQIYITEIIEDEENF